MWRILSVFPELLLRNLIESPTMSNLIQITDTHLFSDTARELYGVNTRQSLQAVLDDIRARDLPVDAILVTGDCVHDEGEQAYRLLGEMLAGLSVPVHYLPGNHDNATVLQSVLVNAPLDGMHHFLLPSWLIVMLDSSLPGKVEGEVLPSTLDKLDTLLQQHPDTPVLVAVHHHPLKVGSQWMDRIGLINGDALMQILNGFGQVRVLINGHIHQSLEVISGHVQVLGTPSTCFQFMPATPEAGIDTAPPAYRYLQLFDDGSFATRLYQLGQD